MMSRIKSDGNDGHRDDSAVEKLKLACIEIASLWFLGFKDACCLHRVYFFCRRSRKIFVKSGQCFILNGGVFLGSILFFQRVVVPILQWLLVFPVKEGVMGTSGDLFIAMIQNMLIGVCYVFWLYPLYIISFVINCIWYNEIAQQAFAVAEEHITPTGKQTSVEKMVVGSPHPRSQSNGGMESILLNIGEQIYSVIMLSIFFIEVFAVSLVPYIGNFLNFLLLSWLYAYYCFDYRWGFAQWSLERRLLFFETNWAFFAGFGSPCVLATFFFSQFISYGIMAILFPMALSLETLEANLTPSLTDNAMRLNLSCSVSVAYGSILFLLTVKLIASRFLSLGETLTSFAYFARCINRNTSLKRVSQFSRH